MKKQFLSITMVLFMVLLLLPKGAFAATTYDIWVGGVQITEQNKVDVFGDGSVEYTPEHNGYAQTLTFKNAHISNGTADAAGNHYGIYCSGDLIIEIFGTNTVRSVKNVITGDSAGISVGGSLRINEWEGKDVTLNVTGGSTTDSIGTSYGIKASRFLMDNGTLVSNSGPGARSIALQTEDIFLMGGGSITATASDDSGTSIGVSCKNIDQSAKTSLTGNAGSARDESIGVSAYKYYPNRQFLALGQCRQCKR